MPHDVSRKSLRLKASVFPEQLETQVSHWPQVLIAGHERG